MSNAQHVAGLLFHRLGVGTQPVHLPAPKPPQAPAPRCRLDDLVNGWPRYSAPPSEEPDDE